jgi:class 3 adenylate cyclase
VHEAARSTAVVDLSPNAPPSQPRSNRSSQSTQSGVTEMEFEMAAARSFMEGEADNLFDRKRVSPPGSAAPTGRKSYPGQVDSPSFFRDPIRRTSSPGGIHSPLLGDQRKTPVMDVNRMVMILTAELRKCAILFIKIGVDVNLFMSPEGVEKKLTPSHIRRRPLASLPFIARSSEEVKADARLLAELQRCLEIMSTTLTENGGQIRQFIHDDKGTVCIGTIGLRGSTTEDNSAAAVETARSIISQLQAVGLNASIGIASGKAFCGLVGSSVRHEYAVMGPSVNLSARLMGAAAAGTILCDEKTKESDRRHKYLSKSAISAKGYDAPVSIYMPLTNAQGRSSMTPSKTPKASKGPHSQLTAPASAPISISTTVAASSGLTPISVPFSRNRSQETSSSEEEGEVSGDEQFIANTESGLCGRFEILKKLLSYVSQESHTAAGSIDSSEEKKSYLNSVPKSDFGACCPMVAPTPSKMKIAFVSGPYGIGKSLVLRAVHHRSLLAPTVPGGLRFKFHAQTNRYNRTSLFYVWKKFISHLLLVLRFQGTRSLSREDLKFVTHSTGQLQSVPENSDFPSPTLPSPPAPSSATPSRKATVMHSSKLLKGAKKQELIRSNIEHLMTLLEPSYRDLEPLVMNGFLCK